MGAAPPGPLLSTLLLSRGTPAALPPELYDQQEKKEKKMMFSKSYKATLPTDKSK